MTSTAPWAARAGIWPMHRVLFLIAGTVTLIGVALTATLSPWFLLVPALVGANQLLWSPPAGARCRCCSAASMSLTPRQRNPVERPSSRRRDCADLASHRRASPAFTAVTTQRPITFPCTNELPKRTC